MASAKKIRQAHATLLQDREAASKLVAASSEASTRRLLADAQRDVDRRLAAAASPRGAGAQSFTGAQLRATLLQVQLVTKNLTRGMGADLKERAEVAGELAGGHAAKYLRAADEAYRGAGEAPLALKEAVMLDRAARGASSSLLHRLSSAPAPSGPHIASVHRRSLGRHRFTDDYVLSNGHAFSRTEKSTSPLLKTKHEGTWYVRDERTRHVYDGKVVHEGVPAGKAHPARVGILERYGAETIKHFEHRLRVGMVAKKSVGEVAEDLKEESPFLKGQPHHWAVRIARTEAHGAYQRAAWEGIREADEQLGGDQLVKILSSTFDDRTGADSYAVHGQVRLVDEAFESWFGMFQCPPDRPNDRAVVVSHHRRWPVPEYLQPRDDEEIEARWRAEGRKGPVPERPQMSTVEGLP